MKNENIELTYKHGKAELIFPEITDEQATAFGRNSLMIQLIESAQNHIKNEQKLILQGMREFAVIAEESYKLFEQAFDGADLTTEDFQAKFVENLRLPTFQDIVNRYENLKQWSQIIDDLENKLTHCRKAATDNSFGISFGQTWRQVIDEILDFKPAQAIKPVSDTDFAEEIKKARKAIPDDYYEVTDGTIQKFDCVWNEAASTFLLPDNEKIGGHIENEILVVRKLT